MKCKICGSENIKITYNGLIRNGGLGKYTDKPVTMWQCCDCGVIWHEPIVDNAEYYESQEYRRDLEGDSEEDTFYRLHDRESLDKFQYTGTDIFRDKIVADIGCGCGAFLDFLKGVAKEIIAVEPSETYRKIMDEKEFHTFAYVSEAKMYYGRVSIVTSFDVIEHVENPIRFIEDIYQLLEKGGKAIIGTPTDAPVMRELLGDIYEQQQLFSTQHLWVLGEKNLKLIADKVGFENVNVKYFQRYGINNLLGWLREKKTRSDINSGYISRTLDETWKAEISDKGLSDYIVLYLEK